MNMFLSSSFIDTSHYFESFIGKTVKGASVTFIPTASNPEDYKGYVDDDKKAFESLGIRVVELDISTQPLKVISQTLNKNDFIYVSGGNTFYLLQALKKSGCFNLFIDIIKTGKPYIGASAGSVIVTPNIEYISKMDDKSKACELTDYNALGLVDFYILPHYGNEPFIESSEIIFKEYKHKIPLKPISNSQVIQIKNTNVSFLG